MKKDNTQNLAIVAIGLGMILYIAADQGLFKFATPQKAEPLPRPAQELARATTEIKRELETISTKVSTKQSEVEDLTSRLSSLKLEIANRARELRVLDPKPTREVAPRTKPRHYSETSLFNSPEIKGRFTNGDGPSEAQQTFPQFKSLADLDRAVAQWKLDNVRVSPTDRTGSPWETFGFRSLFSKKSVYLSKRGLRWAQLVSKTVHDLGGDQIEVSYPRANRNDYSRAIVLRDYLAEFVSPEVNLKINPNEASTDDDIKVSVKLETVR